MSALPLKGWTRLLVALAFCILAGATLMVAQQLPLKSYTTGDGLAHNDINRVVNDSHGFLWFCTGEGLSRFDGYVFTNYGVEQGLPHRTVTGFLETRGGEFWVATTGGLVHFNPQGAPSPRVVYANEVVTPAPMFTVVVPKDKDRYARAITTLLESRDGVVWVGTMKRLYRLERIGGRYELLPADIGVLIEQSRQVHVLDMLEDRHGSLWVASFSGLFRRRPDGRTEQYTKRDGLPDDTIHHLLEDHQGRLWIGTRFGGFFRFAANDGHAPPFVAESYNQRNGLQTDWVFQLYETSDRRFWVATNKGLIEFFPDGDGQGHRFHTWTRRNGLSFQEITALKEDSEGNLWLGTNSSGAMKLARNGFITYGRQEGIFSVQAIFDDPAGRVCFRGVIDGDQRGKAFDGEKLDLLGSDTGTFFERFGCFDGQRFDWFKPSVPFDFGSAPEQIAVQTRDGEWWVGSGAGLYRFPASGNFPSIKTVRPLAVYTTKDGLPYAHVSQIFADSGDNIWIQAFGLARLDRGSKRLRNLGNAAGLPSPRDDGANSFGEDRGGNLWISFNTGVARCRDGRFTFFGADDGLPPGGIRGIYSDRRAGRLWLASTRGGLIRIDTPAADRPAFRRYTTAEGLSANSAGVITEDLYGRIYVSTGRGLDQLTPETGRIKHYTTADGLAPGDIVAVFRDRTGAIWVGTYRGLSRFTPAPATPAPPPPILITGLRVGGEQGNLSALGETAITLAELAHDRNQIQIDFVALGFAPGEVLRYQYKLEGSDADWCAPSDHRTVNYASLAPGRYRFLVRAINSDGILSENPATVTFTILRPVWQRWWFVSLATLGASLAAWVFYRSRIRRIIELERMRTRIAMDLHDDIGSSLSRIAILSEVSRQRLGKEQNGVSESLAQMANTSRDLVDSMSDIVWAINPRRDRVSDLTQRMREFAGDVFIAREIEFSFRAPAGALEVRLDADVRRLLYLIFKEAVNNAARHSQCTHAEIEFEAAQDCLVLCVRDNGRGFDPIGDTGTSRNGNGLASMRERAQALGGEIEIIAQANTGTAVKLNVPLRPRAGNRWRLSV